MARPKGHPKSGGRQKGVENKFTVSMKASVLAVFNTIGADDAFAGWARENQTEFYKIAARLIPTELVGSGPKGEHIVTVNDHFSLPKA